MEHAAHFGHVQQSVSSRRQIEHRLVLRQEPNRSRMCGIGEKADRRPVDPPPIIQLHVSDTTTTNNRVPSCRIYLHNPYYFMYATLMDERGERELNTLSDKKARTMTGSVVASLAHLKDVDGNDGAFFVFPDLSVRCEGVYKLKFSLFEIVGNQVFFCKSITSTMFTVYSAKKFPGMEESTRLTKLFAEQGLKIRVRKEQKTGRPKGARSRPIATAMHSDAGPSAHTPHLSTWGIDQRMGGNISYPGLAAHSDKRPSYSTASVPAMSITPGPGGASLRPSPPSSGQWNGGLHMQSIRTPAGAALPHSPLADRHRQPDAESTQQQQRQYHLQHQARRAAAAPHFQQPQLPPARSQHMLQSSSSYSSHASNTRQGWAPIYESAPPQTRHASGRISPFGDAPVHTAVDYHEQAPDRTQTLPSIAYSTLPPYRQVHSSEDGARQQPSQPQQGFGHQHRPWSPHHRPQPHYNTAPPGHAFVGDSRYSPYNRFSDVSRDGRHQHVLYSARGSGPEQAHGRHQQQTQHPGPRYYQLATSQQHPLHPHRLSSSTPEMPSVGADHSLRGPPLPAQPPFGDERRYSALQIQRPPADSSSMTPTSPSTRQDGRARAFATFSSPPPPPAVVAPSADSVPNPSTQRRIAVHSLLVSDSSSSPERTNRLQ
ncbi:hypothetical protein COEREDRAFT_79756 [Coemansia reversa NRRL 1564]|uniref:Velvet domain-containing protein n=1 Tax=Coemansia reversa (strain ATCC 12441 / NRRL 1564) TaxID=763665 RepID=A0A2G5BIG6_COERN|nr:hypothetical protein COEREDRAFT_79756 [Coemansia reversa NRRL 1564]|eukprot:PIA18772.1 hypothetical protein COEREDRAFT_79756 [Coemansia reversa NRRL 1564]